MTDNGEQPKKIGRPATGKRPIRKYRASDEEWATITEGAGLQGVSASRFVVHAAIEKTKRLRRKAKQASDLGSNDEAAP